MMLLPLYWDKVPEDAFESADDFTCAVLMLSASFFFYAKLFWAAVATYVIMPVEWRILVSVESSDSLSLSDSSGFSLRPPNLYSIPLGCSISLTPVK